MKLRIGYELDYDFPQPTPVILMLNVHFSRVSDLAMPDHIRTQPSVPVSAYREGRGVCRDYAHLAIAFCRAMNIPARYCTCYLGDIGTPPPWPPGDFAASFEAYLEGGWQMFDPRNNVPRIGRVLIACGRDAADVAIATTFGPNTLTGFRVWTDEVTEAP